MGFAYDRQHTGAKRNGVDWERLSTDADYGSNSAQQEQVAAQAAPGPTSWLEMNCSAGAHVAHEGGEAAYAPRWSRDEGETGEDASFAFGAGQAPGQGAPVSPDDPDATKKLFAAQRFHREDYVPSTGEGLFDVAFSPATGELVATLRLAVSFERALDSSGMPWQSTGWTPEEEAQALSDLATAAQTAWSGKHVIQCVKPGWECFLATPRLVVDAFRVGEKDIEPHYTVSLHQARTTPDTDRPSVSHPNLLWNGSAEFEQGDLQDTVVGAQVPDTEYERLSKAAPSLQLEPAATPAGWRLTEQNRRALASFATELGAALPSTYRPPLSAVGWGDLEPGEYDRSYSVGAEAVSVLGGLGVSNRMEARGYGSNLRGTVTFEIQAPELWPREAKYNASAHEIGHMLGLQDEYSAADDEGHGMSEAHQQLLERSGVEQHPIDADTTSIMSCGQDVMPAHYVTLWEALGKMTAAFLQPHEWKL